MFINYVFINIAFILELSIILFLSIQGIYNISVIKSIFNKLVFIKANLNNTITFYIIKTQISKIDDIPKNILSRCIHRFMLF